MEVESEGAAIGIDLGTTYSCVGVWQHSRVEIIPNDQGNRTTPSTVVFTLTGRLIGDSVYNQLLIKPINTIFGNNYSYFSSFIYPSGISYHLLFWGC